MDFIKLLQIHFGKGISKSSLFASSLLHRTGWKYYFYTLYYIMSMSATCIYSKQLQNP